MSDDVIDPKVVAYRLPELERKVDALGLKVDNLSLLVTKSLCPAPGSCLALAEAMKDLKTIVEKHDSALQDVKLGMAQASSSVKTVIAMASGAGSVLGVVASLVVQWLTR